jgi:signal transduction histidine kinase
MLRDITQRRWIETERERLINELEAKNRESETLRESLASIVTIYDLNELLERILDQVKLVIPYDTASVWRVEGDWQIMFMSRHLPKEIPLDDLKLRIDSDNSSRPILNGEKPFVLSNNVQDELPDFKAPHSYINSWLAVPLKTKGKIIGLIALDGIHKNQFNEHHAELIVTFADQVAIALENANLFTDLQTELEERKKLIAELEIKNTESETLRESTAIVAATLEKGQAIERILDQLKRVVPYDSASVQLLKGDFLEIVGGAGLPIGLDEIGSTFYFDEKEPAYPVLTDKLPYVLYDDVQYNVPAFNDIPHDYINSWMAVPLKVNEKTVGIIALDGKKKSQFTERHAQLAVTYANQVAIALENARLFSDLQAELSVRQNLIAELESKNAELERFTYTVSHDLKSPLFTIRGFLGYLEEDALAGNQDRMKSDIQRITDATNKMQQLLNELLELSRIGRMKNESISIPFEELVREAVELVQGRIMERGVAVHIDANMSTIYGDRQRLLEVVQNLVDNAAKFMGDQPEPRIEIGQDGEEDGMPIFHVRDNGIGIPEEHHDRVFGLFNKLDAKSSGTGIGLALVKRIIEIHGGRIWIQGEAGSSTTFHFTLPVPPSI